MQIEALKIYCDVIRHNSFSRAAAENDITQSTASQTVHKLEEHLKVSLIDRSHRPWAVTPAGQLCQQRCQEVLSAYQHLENDLHQFQKAHDHEVRIGTIYSVGLAYMNDYVNSFSQRYPNAKVTVEYCHPRQVCSKVEEGDIDLGILAFPDNHRNLVCIPWCQEEMVVVCAPDHELARRRTVRVRDLAGLSVAGFDRDLIVGQEIQRLLKSQGVQVETAVRFDNIEAIKRAVEISRHVAILPRTTVTRETEAGSLILLPFQDLHFYRPLGIVHRRGISLSPAMKHFVELLKSTRVHPGQCLSE